MSTKTIDLILGTLVTVILAAAIALLIITNARAETSKCHRTSFVFSKLAVGLIGCNLPANVEALGAVARHYCGPGDPAKWPGFEAGGKAMFAELKRDRPGTCARLAKELQ